MDGEEHDQSLGWREHGGVQQGQTNGIACKVYCSTIISITAVHEGDAEGEGYGATVAAPDVVNHSGSSTSSSDPHEMNDNSLSSDDGTEAIQSLIHIAGG